MGFTAPLLLHVNLLLMLFAGAMLATAARLKWDPSAYLAVRGLLPTEYRVLCAALLALPAAILVLAQLAVTATSMPQDRSARYVLLLVYAVLSAVLVVVEVLVTAGGAARAAVWLRTDAARQLQEAMELREKLRPLLEYIERWHPMDDKVKALIDEAVDDAPRNLHVLVGAALALLLLQLTAMALALAARAQDRRLADTNSATGHRARADSGSSGGSVSTTDEKRPLRTKYRNGKLIIV